MKQFLLGGWLLLLAAGGAVRVVAQEMVLVEGGVFRNAKTSYYGRTAIANAYIGRKFAVGSFLIGKYEITQKEWVAVMGSNPSKFVGEDLPVENISWYDCVEYCNRRSEKEGLTPYYRIDKVNKDPDNHTAIDQVKWTVMVQAGANGYRLPTEAEWEYAAGGGKLSKGFTFSGADEVETVAWYFKNSGDKELTGLWNWPMIEQNHNKTSVVGRKLPNELGLYDMSGNVREWCWDWAGELGADGKSPRASTSEGGRVWKGGGWLGGDFCCAISFQGSFEANGKGPDQGVRVCRNP